MICVTVGTHEQQFDRLVAYMDQWAGTHDEEVIIQSGYSRVEPKNCEWRSFYRQHEMDDFVRDARIVITHGGPCCYIEVLKLNKVPIVVPRQHMFGEHVDDHQLEIGRRLKAERNNIILIEHIDQLGDAIEHYDEITRDMNHTTPDSLNVEFCGEFSKIVNKLFE